MTTTKVLPAAETQVVSTEELRRAALARSARRGAEVARQRVAGRWALWLVGLLFRWAALPATVAALWAWQNYGHDIFNAQAKHARSSTPQAQSPPASSPLQRLGGSP